MDYSSANMSLWNIIIQLGLIAGVILLSQFLRSKLSFVRKSMMPVAVLGGFILLILKYLGVAKLDAELLEMLVYHCIALGFIAMSLRTTGGQKSRGGQRIGLRSGALIVSTYLVQGVAGLIITMGLAYTFMPGLFKAAGLLLPMGYGQGPGQANNIGGSYETMGFTGGQSFGLAIAASGYLCACIVGVIMLNILSRRHKITPRTESKGSRDLSVGFFQDNNELPVSDSIDRLSVQFALILLVYLLTYLLIIKQSNIDIYDIKIEEITNQYLDYIKKMEELNLNIASSYLVMAAELIEMKASMLLPKPEIAEDEYEEDPKERLIKRLIEYQNYKEITTKFHELELDRQQYYTKQSSDISEYEVNPNLSDDISLTDLLKAFEQFLNRQENNKPLNTKITTKEYSITKRSKEIKDLIRKNKKINFTDLFEIKTKSYIIVTFLSILMLAKNNDLRIIQNNNFENILLCEV